MVGKRVVGEGLQPIPERTGRGWVNGQGEDCVKDVEVWTYRIMV